MPVTTPTTLVRGTKLPLGQRTIYDFDPVRGYIIRTELEGAGQVEMLATHQDYVRQGIANRLIYERDRASLEVEDSTQTYLLDTWQVDGNEETRDGLSHPNLSFLIDATTLIRVVRLYIDDPTDTNYTALTADPTYQALGLNNQEALDREIDRQLKGDTGYKNGQYALIHTTNAPSNYQANVADFGVDAIYSSGQFLSEISNSNLWVLVCPPRLQFKMQQAASDLLSRIGAVPANYMIGWLKSASTEGTAANNRIDIRTTYVLDIWSTDKYSVF